MSTLTASLAVGGGRLECSHPHFTVYQY